MAKHPANQAEAMLAKNERDAKVIRKFLTDSCQGWHFNTNLSMSQIADLLREVADWFDPTADTPVFMPTDEIPDDPCRFELGGGG